MSEVSKTVRDKVKRLYATLATVAAQKAVNRASQWDDYDGAMEWAGYAEECLIKSGAEHARWKYEEPRIKS